MRTIVGWVAGVSLTAAALSQAPRAHACTPKMEPPKNGIESFTVASGEAELAVANDGFFVIQTDGRYLPADSALKSLAVQVKASNGDVIPGSLHAIRARPEVLYWLADAPLPEASYEASVSAPSKPNLPAVTAQLRAKGERALLSLPEIRPREWLELHDLSGGKQLTCQAIGTCGSITFGEEVVITPGVDVGIEAQALNGSVYWDVTVDIVHPPPDATYSLPYANILRSGSEGGGELRLLDQDEHDQACLVTTVVDLRDDTVLKSAPRCWPRQAGRIVDNTGIIAGCPLSPSPALDEIWCAHHPGACAGSAGAGGSIGNPLDPEQGGSAGGAGSAGDSPRAGAAPSDRSDDSSSSACAVGYSRRTSGLGVAALLGLSAFWLRRRRVTRG